MALPIDASFDGLHIDNPSTPKANGVHKDLSVDLAPNRSLHNGDVGEVEELQAELIRTREEKELLEGQYRTLLDRLSEMKSKIGQKLKQDAVRIRLPLEHVPSYPIWSPYLCSLIHSNLLTTLLTGRTRTARTDNPVTHRSDRGPSTNNRHAQLRTSSSKLRSRSYIPRIRYATIPSTGRIGL